MGEYERNQEYLQKLLESVGLDSEDNDVVTFEDESDKEEQDIEEILYHQSESEQDISDTEDSAVGQSNGLVYISMLNCGKNNCYC